MEEKGIFLLKRGGAIEIEEEDRKRSGEIKERAISHGKGMRQFFSAGMLGGQDPWSGGAERGKKKKKTRKVIAPTLKSAEKGVGERNAKEEIVFCAAGKMGTNNPHTSGSRGGRLWGGGIIICQAWGGVKKKASKGGNRKKKRKT